jgi:hypothetical protein
MSKLRFAIGVVGALAVGACSSSSSPSSDAGSDMATDIPADAGPALVTVSGTASPHPLTAVLEAPPLTPTDFSMMAVAVVDPSIVLANPAAPPLQGGPLNTMSANCPGGACAWSFDNVDITNISLGLVGIVDDLRTTNRLWVKTGTGAGASDFIDTIKVSRQPITNRTLFAVSKVSEGKLAAFAAAVIPDTTIVAGALETRGFMIGTVVSKLSQGATPVGGAIILATSAATMARVSIIYPNDGFTGVGTSTSAVHGTFLVVPKPVSPPTSIVGSWSVTSPAGDTRVWPSLTAGSTPGTAFVILFAANETP